MGLSVANWTSTTAGIPSKIRGRQSLLLHDNKLTCSSIMSVNFFWASGEIGRVDGLMKSLHSPGLNVSGIPIGGSFGIVKGIGGGLPVLSISSTFLSTLTSSPSDISSSYSHPGCVFMNRSNSSSSINPKGSTGVSNSASSIAVILAITARSWLNFCFLGTRPGSVTSEMFPLNNSTIRFGIVVWNVGSDSMIGSVSKFCTSTSHRGLGSRNGLIIAHTSMSAFLHMYWQLFFPSVS